MTSQPVYTSKAEGFRTAEEIAAMRPVAPVEKRRVPRKPSDRPVISSGIVCFCGERFSEARSLEFMLHLRAEYGEVLSWKRRFDEVQRAAKNRYKAKPEVAERIRDHGREYRARPEVQERIQRRQADPEIRERHREYDRRYRTRVAADPERQDRKNSVQRESRARRMSDPAYRERQNAKRRERYARKEAEREAPSA